MINIYPTPDTHEIKPGFTRITSLVSTAVVIRAGIVALVLGSILTLTNQSGAIFGEASVQVLPLCLVFLTPFIVVTISQVLGIQRAFQDAGQHQTPAFLQDNFLTTTISHGIAVRSVLVSLSAGSINTTIIVSTTLIAGKGLAEIPSALIAQTFVLPMLFGIISQAISYRRATRKIFG